MKSEAKQCQNCKNEFTIEPEDFLFYEKIKVPASTWCPECIWQLLFLWRNERSLYKRKCNAPGHEEEIISIFPPDSEINSVYDYKFWWSDNWDSLQYGREYNFSEPFLQQFGKLLASVPQPNVIQTNSINSEYCNSVLGAKNCYLVFAASRIENTYYSSWLDEIRDCLDILWSHHGELGYENVLCNDFYKLFFSGFSEECSESAFLWDCRGCSYCFGCVGLRNKQYHIFNKPYSKEEYFSKIKEYNLGSFAELSKIKKDFQEFKLKYPHKYARITNSVNSTGDNLKNAKNAFYCFDSTMGAFEDCRYVAVPFGKDEAIKDSHSSFGVGHGFSFAYQSASVITGSSVFFSKKIWTGYNIQYSYNCHNCHDLFACVGLRNKSYCILNKQYSKEEYEKLVPQIIDHMNQMPYTDSKGRIYRYGEFFPPERSPFAYNETIAQEYFPLTKEQAEQQGYRWKEPETKNYQITKTPDQLPDHIKDVKDGILNDIIQCAHVTTSQVVTCNEQCTTAFRIIPQELEFYRKNNIALPRLCPNCRHYQRLKQRNPLKLWQRKCQCSGTKSDNGIYQNQTNHFHQDQHCPNEFETSYAPERQEIVYCEECYQQEVV
ncbi:MAG: hypothetical protein Q8R29_03655 [bacterium]|nr:hypothetical protein [bacterium]